MQCASFNNDGSGGDPSLKDLLCDGEAGSSDAQLLTAIYRCVGNEGLNSFGIFGALSKHSQVACIALDLMPERSVLSLSALLNVTNRTVG